MDETNLAAGDRWRPEIEAAIKSSRTVAVFVGKTEGRVQDREFDLVFNLESRGELKIIPVILPSCEDDAEIDGFLQSYNWVDFRQGHSDPLDQLCSEIRRVETSPGPVGAIAPTSNSSDRSRLIVYCQNAGLHVPRAGIYPPDAESALELFTADLDQGDLVVQLDEPNGLISLDEIEKARSSFRNSPPVEIWKSGGRTQSEFQKDVCDRARRIFDATHSHLEIEPGSKGAAAGEGDSRQKSAMVRYDQVDGPTTCKMLRALADADIRCTSSPNGSTALVQRLRENPFDALVLVLGECRVEWLEKQIDELNAVELTLKDQSPLRVYYYPDGSTAAPPVISRTTLEFDGGAELDQLANAIRGGSQ